MAVRVGKGVVRRPSSSLSSIDGYRTIEPIGRGSFGTVYKVQRESDGKILVCKSMSYGGMSEREKQLIVSEVNILRELRHPNIVRYYDRVIDKQNTKIYIVMEYCEGGDLGKQIKRRKRTRHLFDEARIWKLFSQLCLAFQRCHSHKESINGEKKTTQPILHRDVKPGNIFIDAHGNAKLGDFGLAKELNCESRFAYTNVGTPYYMSPEMVNEHKYNEKVDIWSIGCLIYEMAALRPPFEAKNVVALGKKINAGVFERIPSCYTDDLQSAISSMLQINPARRPSVFQLLSLPMVVRCLNEAKLATKEVEFNSKLQHAFQQVKTREEDLRRREEALNDRERQLDAREQELSRKASELRDLERSINNKSPSSIGTSRSTVNSSLGSFTTPILKQNSDTTRTSSSGNRPSSLSRTRTMQQTIRIDPAGESSDSDQQQKRFLSAFTSRDAMIHSPDSAASASSDSSTNSSLSPRHEVDHQIRRAVTSTGNTPSSRISVSIRKTQSSSPVNPLTPSTPTDATITSNVSSNRYDRDLGIGQARRRSSPTTHSISPNGSQYDERAGGTSRDLASRRISLPTKGNRFDYDRGYLGLASKGASRTSPSSVTLGIGTSVASKPSYVPGRSKQMGSPASLAGGTTLARLRLEREAAVAQYASRETIVGASSRTRRR